VIHCEALALQQDAQAPVSETPALTGDYLQPFSNPDYS